MPQTVVEKIAQRHLVEGPGRPLRAGDVVSLRPRHLLTHDNTSAVMKKFEGLGAERIAFPEQPVFVLDHDIQNTSAENLAKYREIEAFAARHGVRFFPAGSGIGHQIMVDHGYALPGALVVASDSHANMYGALGALGTPVVRTDAAAIWATGDFWWEIPPTLEVHLSGRLREGVSGKDVILTLCGLYGRGEALNAVVEFAGPGVATLGMAERLAIANMTTEWGALAGWFPVDRATEAYLRERADRLGRTDGFARTDLEALFDPRDLPAPDPEARYAGRIALDLGEVTPSLTGPDTVQRTRPVSEAEAEAIPIHKAYLVSCVNSRLEDLQAAAAVLRGRGVAEGVELYVAAASAEIQAEAERSGAWSDLLAAGARPLPPGCGPCIGLGAGLLEPGEHGISATNRNFKGRMGSRDARTWLASPEVVAASAVAGRIRGPAPVHGVGPAYRYESFDGGPAAAFEPETILPGFPAELAGRPVLLPRDDINTDGIYGKDWTYREDMTPEAMAEVVFRNYDPELAGRLRPGDILVAGRNFGTGSSREQAATAVQAAGVRLVIAESFSRTYLRNAWNNGFPCIECPSLARRMRGELTGGNAVAATAIPCEDVLRVDFARGCIEWRDGSFDFPPPGAVPQALVVAGGLEARVRQRLSEGP